jgi:PncC family amidohydrolase
LSKTPVNFVVAVSGVAGPTGGTKVNPVGTVWIGVQKRDKLAVVNKYNFKGDREIIRYNAVEQALKNLTQLVKG